MPRRKVVVFLIAALVLLSFYPTQTSAYELKKIKGNVGSDGSLTIDADYSLNWIEKLFIFFHFSSVGDYIQKNMAVLGTSVDIISATEDHAKLKIYNYATVQDDVYYTNGASWDKNVEELVIIFLDGYKYQKSNTNTLPMLQHTTKEAETKISYDINAGPSTPKIWETIVLSNMKEEIAEKFANTIFDEGGVESYWAKQQAAALSYISNDFIEGLVDPLELIASSSGINTYSDAATAIKQFVTIGSVIQATDYAILFQTCRRPNGITVNYNFKMELKDLEQQIREGKDISGKARELKSKLVQLKSDIDQCPDEMLASYNWGGAKKAKDSSKKAVDGAIDYLDGLTKS